MNDAQSGVVELKTKVSNNRAGVVKNQKAITTNKSDIKSNKTTIVKNRNNISRNTTAITSNTSAIANNGQKILANSNRLNDFDLRLKNFGVTIGENRRNIVRFESKLAAFAAVPDMVLASDETYAVSGGFSVTNNKTGFGGGVAIRADDRWSFSAGLGVADKQAVGKLQLRFAR